MARDKTDRSDKTSVSTIASSAPDLQKAAYRQAVEKAKSSLVKVLDPSFNDGSYDDVVALYGGLMSLEENPALLVARSETSAEEFLALRLGVAGMLKTGKPLPAEAIDWLVRYLDGTVSPPALKTGAKSKSVVHNVINHAVADCLRFGLKPTRNDASLAVSACDAVADAMAELELRPATFHGIKRIWLACPPNVRKRHIMKARGTVPDEEE